MPAPLRIRVFNPRTGTDTGRDHFEGDEARAAAEIEALAGVQNGFVDLINAAGATLEVFCPSPAMYMVVHDRDDSQRVMLERDAVLRRLAAFAKG